MKALNWSLLLLVLLAPLSVGCGGHSAGPTAQQDEVTEYFANHPEDAVTTEDTGLSK